MAAPLRLARDSARSLGHPPKHAGCADGPHQRGRPRIGLRLAAAPPGGGSGGGGGVFWGWRDTRHPHGGGPPCAPRVLTPSNFRDSGGGAGPPRRVSRARGGGPPAAGAGAGRRPRRGTKEWRAVGSALGSDGGRGAREEDRRFDSFRAADAWTGGPLVLDRLWAWGEGGLHQIDRTVLGGQREERTGRGGRFKLNAQPRSDTSVILAGSRGRSEGTGIGAGPGRAPETTWEEDGREDVWAAEGFSVVSRSFYLGASLGGSDRRLGDDPRGAGGEARIGPDGVARGGWFDLREERKTEQARLVANVFASTRSVEHEIVLGTGWRGQDE